MTINIATKAAGGHLILYVLDSKQNELLKVRDTKSGSIMLVPGKTYRFEWHVWGSQSADYEIHANVTPVDNGFPDFDWQKHYDDPHQDMGGFYFSLTPNA